MDDVWLARQRAEVKEEAEAECARCGARGRGTCSSQCRFWHATASEPERERVAREGADMQPRTVRPWYGPVMAGEWQDAIDEGE